uniref:Uncharacterized protein n=1 Tax=Nicotiana tabacum TaxID=4097 RepID=A0A1S3WXZ9_TOBAC|nr:PREDICTED: uncharacterized protein LOC107759128 [Nicotiana tabacum]
MNTGILPSELPFADAKENRKREASEVKPSRTRRNDSEREASGFKPSKLEKFYDILKQLSVNIPFVEVFQEIPGFDKYLKYLITKKQTIKNETVSVTYQISSIISTTSVQKKEDLGAFTIPCTIRLRDFARDFYDNGDSINLMPLGIHKQAVLGMPRPTSMRLQMANHLVK